MRKLIIILSLTLVLTGCFNYRDVNRVVFVTAVFIDIDENNNPILYTEAYKSVALSGEAAGGDSRILLKGTGDTIFEASRHLNDTSGLKLNYTQNKAIIFSEKASKYGLNEFIDVFFRDQELLARQFLYTTNIDLEELMKIELQEEMFLGIYLSDLTENKPAQTRQPLIRIDEYFITRKLGSKIVPISFIEKKEGVIMPRITTHKLAIFNEDKFINVLDYDESFYYTLLIDKLTIGYTTVPHPNIKDALITLEIANTNLSQDIKYDGNTIYYTKKVKLQTTIAEVQKTFNISYLKDQKALEKSAEENIKKNLIDLYEKYKEQDIDIYNLQKDIDIKYPNADIDSDNIFDSVNFSIEVDVSVQGSTDVIDFY